MPFPDPFPFPPRLVPGGVTPGSEGPGVEQTVPAAEPDGPTTAGP